MRHRELFLVAAVVMMISPALLAETAPAESAPAATASVSSAKPATPVTTANKTPAAPAAAAIETTAATAARANKTPVASTTTTPGAPSEAAVDPNQKCIDKLSQGTNSLKVKPSARALSQLSQGLAKFASKLDEKHLGLVVDYSMNSKRKRAFLVDFKSCDILANEYVIHGGTVYHPEVHRYGDPDDDGMLDTCTRRDGSHQYMTRPGFFLTSGCHNTSESNWTNVTSACEGIKLRGLESRNVEAYDAGIVLHEHRAIPNDSSIKPVGQGCPAFPPGRLKNMLRFGLMEHTLVFVYAPQCSK